MTLFSLRRVVFRRVGFLSIGLLLSACGKREPASAAHEGPADAAASAPAPAASPTNDSVNLDKVRGAWTRTDGGYRLVIGDIGHGGHAKAGYFNPNPINVAWTRVRAEGAAIKVDLELRDENYPGCLYKLTYDPSRDVLAGTYFQAQLQETYQIEFARQN